MRHDDANVLSTAWLAAVRSGPVRAELERVYARLADATLERRPRCDASGRCCRFEEWGHRLYVTGLEAAYTVAGLGGADRQRTAPMDRDAESAASRTVSLPQAPDAQGSNGGGNGRVLLDGAALGRAVGSGGCPFHIDSLCGVHPIRPLGCRVYYCDPTAQDWQQAQSEAMLADIRAIHDRHGLEYRYGEWRIMLGMFLGDDGQLLAAD